MIDLSTIGAALIADVITLFTALFVTIPTSFISAGISSGALFDVVYQFFGNAQVKRLAFLLVLVGGPLLVAMSMKKHRGDGVIGNKR